MTFNRMKRSGGFTLVELMVTIFTALIVIFGVGVYMVDIYRGYGRMYDRVHGQMAQDAYVAKRAFDGIVRKAASVAVWETGARFYYWQEFSQENPDGCADFYMDGANNLMLAKGLISSPQTECLAENAHCKFYVTGQSVQMVLTLDNGRRSVKVVSSAIVHNANSR